MNEEADRVVAAVALDVGGTTTHAALVTDHGSFGGPVTQVASRADAARRVILQGLTDLVAEVVAAATPDTDLDAIGVAFPGPFDYANGVPLMSHKFASVYGLALAHHLAGGTGLEVAFLNDGDAFALGAWWSELTSVSRLVGVTLGTGIGSGFVVLGEIADDKSGAPPGGEIWDLPFGDGILEDVVSARAIENSYVRSGGDPSLTVRDIAERARSGDGSARTAFAELADNLGEGLAAVTEGFEPEHVVFGGQISKAFDLFGKQAASTYAHATGRSVPLTSTTVQHPALLGAGRYALTNTGIPPSSRARR